MKFLFFLSISFTTIQHFHSLLFSKYNRKCICFFVESSISFFDVHHSLLSYLYNYCILRLCFPCSFSLFFFIFYNKVPIQKHYI